MSESIRRRRRRALWFRLSRHIMSRLTFIWIGCLLLILVAGWLQRRSDGQWESIAGIMRDGAWIALGISLLSFVGPYLWSWLLGVRPQPEPTEETLFQGVTYTREVWQEPRPVVIHVVRIDLTAPGIDLIVTPPVDDNGTLAGLTTSDFARQQGVQIAINGDFFDPWRDHGPLDFYPRRGNRVFALGYAVSGGEVYSQGRVNHPTISVMPHNRVVFGIPRPHALQAISGNAVFVQDGQPRSNWDVMHPYNRRRHPRTAIGLTADRRTLLLFVVDGRQPGYSVGVTMPELSEIAVKYGAQVALNLDGGGSSTLVVQGADGDVRVINTPVHNHLPGRERPIANHFGVYARSLGWDTSDLVEIISRKSACC